MKIKGFKLSVDKTGKDQGKANCANAYIGFGVTGRKSSTGIYLEDAGQQGIPVNDEIMPNPDTVAFISVASEGTFVNETVILAKKVIDAGGTVIMDRHGTGFGQSHSRFNRNGEGKVQDALGEPDGKTKEGYSVWGNLNNI
ncbi:MAG: hypothetical protein LBV74_02080 [Tannerella sp.]|nr:hypothetical protein [Tannerella sp.]